MKKNFYVFQDWIAKELAEAGFSYITRPDLKDPTKIVYIFTNSLAIQDLFRRLLKQESK